jgi:hypothetical protein
VARKALSRAEELARHPHWGTGSGHGGQFMPKKGGSSAGTKAKGFAEKLSDQVSGGGHHGHVAAIRAAGSHDEALGHAKKLTGDNLKAAAKEHGVRTSGRRVGDVRADLVGRVHGGGVKPAAPKAPTPAPKMVQKPSMVQAPDVTAKALSSATPDEAERLLAHKKVAELREIARSAGVVVPARATKPQLQDALRRWATNDVPDAPKAAPTTGSPIRTAADIARDVINAEDTDAATKILAKAKGEQLREIARTMGVHLPPRTTLRDARASIARHVIGHAVDRAAVEHGGPDAAAMKAAVEGHRKKQLAKLPGAPAAQKATPAPKKAALKPAASIRDVAERVIMAESHDDAEQVVAKLKGAELKQLAETLGVHLPKSTTVGKARADILHHSRSPLDRMVIGGRAGGVDRDSPAKMAERKAAIKADQDAWRQRRVAEVRAKAGVSPAAASAPAPSPVADAASRLAAAQNETEAQAAIRDVDPRQLRALAAELGVTLPKKAVIGETRNAIVDKALTGKKSMGSRMSTKPILKNNWGTGTGEVEFHADGAIGRALDQMGDDQHLDIDGEPLANVLGRMATATMRGQRTPQQLVDDTKQLRDRLPAGSRARQALDGAVRSMDAPARATPSLPDATPTPLRTLMDDLIQIPLARQPKMGETSLSTSEVDRLADVVDRWAAGQLSPLRLIGEVGTATLNNRHESLEGKAAIDQAVRKALAHLEAMLREDRTSLYPPKA